MTVAVHDLGGSGPDLLMAHATGFHGRVWQPVADLLADTFHCVAFDQRAHGDSPPPADGNYAWAGLADDARAAMAAAGLHHPLAVGHSAGGAALLLVEEDDPGTFPALWCFEPVVFPPFGETAAGPAARSAPNPLVPNPLAESARRRRSTFPSRQAALDNYASKPPMSAFAPDALAAYVEHGFVDADGGVRLACEPESEARFYEMSREHSAFERLDRVACPVTLAYGTETTHFPPAIFAAQAERLASPARVEPITGLGHFGPLEDPVRIAASIRAAFA